MKDELHMVDITSPDAVRDLTALTKDLWRRWLREHDRRIRLEERLKAAEAKIAELSSDVPGVRWVDVDRRQETPMTPVNTVKFCEYCGIAIIPGSVHVCNFTLTGNMGTTATTTGGSDG